MNKATEAQMLKALEAAYPVLETMPVSMSSQDARAEHARLVVQVDAAIRAGGGTVVYADDEDEDEDEV